MMTILLTGAAGFIGSIVTEQLLNKGLDVVGVDNFQEGYSTNVNKDIIFYEGNYGDKILLNEIFSNHKIDCVFHFAAETTVEFSMTDPLLYFDNNVVNGVSLLEAMIKHGVKKMIFSSTAAVYGEPENIPINEEHAKNPVNAYGASKLMYEGILEWCKFSYGLKYNLFRYFNAAGASETTGENRKHESHLLPLIFKSILDDNFILNVYGKDYSTKDGTCVRDYVHVKDIANAHILGLSNLDKIPNGKYNLGSSTGFTILEVIEAVEKVTNKKVKWRYQNRRSGDPEVLVASNVLAKKELRWEINYSKLETIVEDAYRWYLICSVK
jgi:UDP-glucose 4-epimerase